MGLACNFRRQKDREKSPVIALLMLVVACEGIACTAEHPPASGGWFVLPSFLSSTTMFLFCWSIKGADGQSCVLVGSVLAAIYETNVFLAFSFSSLTVALKLGKKGNMFREFIKVFLPNV